MAFPWRTGRSMAWLRRLKSDLGGWDRPAHIRPVQSVPPVSALPNPPNPPRPCPARRSRTVKRPPRWWRARRCRGVTSPQCGLSACHRREFGVLWQQTARAMYRSNLSRVPRHVVTGFAGGFILRKCLLGIVRATMPKYGCQVSKGQAVVGSSGFAVNFMPPNTHFQGDHRAFAWSAGS